MKLHTISCPDPVPSGGPTTCHRHVIEPKRTDQKKAAKWNNSCRPSFRPTCGTFGPSPSHISAPTDAKLIRRLPLTFASIGALVFYFWPSKAIPIQGPRLFKPIICAPISS